MWRLITRFYWSFEQMYSSVKNSCERDIGVYGFNPEHLTLHSKEGGHEAGLIEAQSTSH